MDPILENYNFDYVLKMYDYNICRTRGSFGNTKYHLRDRLETEEMGEADELRIRNDISIIRNNLACLDTLYNLRHNVYGDRVPPVLL